MQNQNQAQQLDQSVVALTKAIGQSESGGNYSAQGKSGEHGAYQYTKPTWDSDSQKYLGQAVPLEQATPAQQDEVAYKKVQDLGKQGYKPDQIASIWNSGKPDYQGNVGTNKYGVKYDTPAYVKSVGAAYDRIMKGQSAGMDPNNPSASGTQNGQQNSNGFINAASIPPAGTVPSGDRQIPGWQQSLNKGDYLKAAGQGASDAVQAFGNAVTGGGAGVLGQSIGTLGGLLKEKISGALGGQDNSRYYDTSAPSIGDTALAAGKTIAAGYGAKGLGAAASGLSGLISGGSALASPAVEGAMANFNMPIEEFQSLSSSEKLNALSEALKGANTSDSMVLKKAIEEVTPGAMRELGTGTFAERYPGIAKSMGLMGRLIKGAGKTVPYVGAGLVELKDLFK